MSRPITEQPLLKLGGTIVSKYQAYDDILEVILIIRSSNHFYAVVTTGRQAHRALRLDPNRLVEITGPIIDYILPEAVGYKIVYAVACQKLRIGDELTPSPDPFPDDRELSKLSIFKKCADLNNTTSGASSSNPGT